MAGVVKTKSAVCWNFKCHFTPIFIMLATIKSQFYTSSRRIFTSSRNMKVKNEDVNVHHNLHKYSAILTSVLGTPSKESHEILQKHPELLSLDPNDIKKTVEILKSLNYTKSEIQNKPMMIYCKALTIENRYVALKECGCSNISLGILAKYVTVMNREIVKLKSMGIIPFETNVMKRLEECFPDVEVKLKKDYGEDVILKNLRKLVLEEYLRKRLDVKESDLEKTWKTYFRLKHRSFKSVIQMIDILLNDLAFPKERIIKNGFLLHGDPENTKRMMSEIKEIGGEDIREILYRRPKIIMSNCDSIKKTIEHIKSFNIPESAIIKCLEVLTLGSDTVLERLEDLNNIEEFQVLTSNPRVLRLVHYQNKARLRLDYLNQVKVRCASLHILSCGSNAFEKFARDGTDRTKGKDIIVYLSKVFNRPEGDVRVSLSRHPNWCHIPVVSIKHCYDTLIAKKFSADDIFHNIHILLYPEKRIKEKLAQLQSHETYIDFQLDTNYSTISNKKLLTLCLYLIELEFHFTGDGMWTEEHHNLPVENFHNILPDFPESNTKVYKYGTKPPKQKKMASISQ